MPLMPPKHPFQIALDGSVSLMEPVRPAKITGTSLGAIVGESPWDTPFTVACRLLGVHRVDISDKPAVRTGTILEPSILEAVGAVPAEEIFAKREGDHDAWESDFEDAVFAGHIDGMMPDGRVCEVKTTSDLSAWEDGVPKHYWLQASLYSHFLADDADITFAVGEVDGATYADPYSWAPQGRTYTFTVPPFPGLDRILEYARYWHHLYIEQGRTPAPDMDDARDLAVLNDLRSMTMTDDELVKLVDEIACIQREIDDYDSAIKGIRADLDAKKDVLRTQMIMRNMGVLDGENATATLSAQKKDTFDLAKARADGLAGIEPYISSKVTNVLRFKKKPTKVKE